MRDRLRGKDELAERRIKCAKTIAETRVIIQRSKDARERVLKLTLELRKRMER
jgi:hypothetical protein